MRYTIKHKKSRKSIENPGIVSDTAIKEIIGNAQIFLADDTNYHNLNIEFVFQYTRRTRTNNYDGLCITYRYHKKLTHRITVWVCEYWQWVDKKLVWNMATDYPVESILWILGHELGNIYTPTNNFREYKRKGMYYNIIENAANEFSNLISPITETQHLILMEKLRESRGYNK